MKLENLQHTGAYKVRGALNALAMQVGRGDRRSVVAASAGNHSAGMAYAARCLGLRAIAVVPESAPQSKIQRTEQLGAQVIVRGAGFEEAQEYAQSLARREGARFLPAFDDPDVIAGQGTLGWEVLAHRPDVVLVPVGGGGLASGMGLVLKAHGIRLVGVQVAGVDSMRRTLAGEPLSRPASTIADGTRVYEPGQLTRRICRTVLDEIVTVSEREVVHAMVRLAREENLMVEGAGALSVAALPKVHGRRRLAVISGGNVDIGQLSALVLGQRSSSSDRYSHGKVTNRSAEMTLPPRPRTRSNSRVSRGLVA